MLETNTSIVLLSVIFLVGLLNLILVFTKKQKDFSPEFQKLRNDISDSSSPFQTALRNEFKSNRDELSNNSKLTLDIVHDRLESFQKTMNDLLNGFEKRLNTLTDTNQKGFDTVKDSLTNALRDSRLEINQRLESIQTDTNKQLDKMRETVDEKLQETLEKRLGDSFKIVSDRLEAVHKGLGEMKNLATGVGDLKKVLTNVKTRGVMGEIQLHNILDQLLTADQYGVNVSTIPGSQCHVEFAIKLPGKDKDQTEVWLPIDSKFPMDKYASLQDAYESGDGNLIKDSKKQLTNTIKSMAKDIRDKYIQVPYTTDFGILFLPTEGLFADVVRDAELVHLVQNEYKIMLAGPTNLAALLNSLQMGFRSLAIEERSSEVWKILGAVKSEFGKFGKVLDKVQSKLQQASNTIDQVGVRSRAIERNLRTVEALPNPKDLLELPFDDGVDMEDFSNGLNQ